MTYQGPTEGSYTSSIAYRQGLGYATRIETFGEFDSPAEAYAVAEAAMRKHEYADRIHVSRGERDPYNGVVHMHFVGEWDFDRATKELIASDVDADIQEAIERATEAPVKTSADIVASRTYRDHRSLTAAIYAHNKAVTTAKRGTDADRAKVGPPLTLSGTTVMAHSDYECQACYRSVGRAFNADSESHHIVSRSGYPVRRPVSLCVPCWSRLCRDEGEVDDVEPTPVRFG